MIFKAAAAVRAVFNVDVEDPFEQPGPTHARRRTLRVRVIARGLGCLLYRTGNDFTAQLRVGGASTPWKRIRCKRGRGTRAARRCNEVVDGADSALRPWKIFAKQDAGVSSQGVPNDTPS